MKLIFLYGPTASGKTDLSIRLAKKFQAEIINCDSVQVYKYLDIGTAKIEPEEQQGVPHHLLSFVDYPEKYNAQKFRRDCLTVINEAEQRGVKAMILVGGTGFYFQAFERGMPELAKIPLDLHLSLQKRADMELEQMYRELELLDPEYAKKVEAKDRYRVTRALEILTIQPDISLTEQFKKRESELAWPVFKIFLNPNRTALRERLKLRTLAMFQKGFLDEVRSLLEKSYGDWSALESVGYRQILEMLEGKMNQDQCVELITVKSMQLAKRQSSWFKRETSDLQLESPEDLSLEHIYRMQVFLDS